MTVQCKVGTGAGGDRGHHYWIVAQNSVLSYCDIGRVVSHISWQGVCPNRDQIVFFCANSFKTPKIAKNPCWHRHNHKLDSCWDSKKLNLVLHHLNTNNKGTNLWNHRDWLVCVWNSKLCPHFVQILAVSRLPLLESCIFPIFYLDITNCKDLG